MLAPLLRDKPGMGNIVQSIDLRKVVSERRVTLIRAPSFLSGRLLLGWFGEHLLERVHAAKYSLTGQQWLGRLCSRWFLGRFVISSFALLLRLLLASCAARRLGGLGRPHHGFKSVRAPEDRFAFVACRGFWPRGLSRCRTCSGSCLRRPFDWSLWEPQRRRKPGSAGYSLLRMGAVFFRGFQTWAVCWLTEWDLTLYPRLFSVPVTLHETLPWRQYVGVCRRFRGRGWCGWRLGRCCLCAHDLAHKFFDREVREFGGG